MAEKTGKAAGKPCDVCKGKGKCRTCRGRGVMIGHAGTPATRCLDCHGTGECPACKGEGVLKD